MRGKTLHIVCHWDEDVKVWYVKESDVPGLSLEASSEKEMIKKLCKAIPEMLDLNAHLMGGKKRQPERPKALPRVALKMEKELQLACR